MRGKFSFSTRKELAVLIEKQMIIFGVWWLQKIWWWWAKARGASDASEFWRVSTCLNLQPSDSQQIAEFIKGDYGGGLAEPFICSGMRLVIYTSPSLDKSSPTMSQELLQPKPDYVQPAAASSCSQRKKRIFKKNWSHQSSFTVAFANIMTWCAVGLFFVSPPSKEFFFKFCNILQ